MDGRVSGDQCSPALKDNNNQSYVQNARTRAEEAEAEAEAQSQAQAEAKAQAQAQAQAEADAKVEADAKAEAEEGHQTMQEKDADELDDEGNPMHLVLRAPLGPAEPTAAHGVLAVRRGL